MNTYHTSVLLDEAISALNVRSNKTYVDATLGGGGHTEAILQKGGIVVGIDQDQEAIDFVSSKLNDANSRLLKGNFAQIDEIVHKEGIDLVSGVIFDLGVSSHQLDEAKRGFSYQKEGPLDMRMDQELGVKASDLVNVLNKGELIDLFRVLGEERKARYAAEAIIEARTQESIQTTDQLASILTKVYGFRDVNEFSRAQSSKRVFQALRMKVNSELENLKEALPKAFSLLEKEGRLVVISFHSLEDRIVKDAFKDFEAKGEARIISKKPILPTQSEITVNKRSKGAKLRVLEKI